MSPFVKRDLDGFFGLFVDNLVQLLLIIGFCQALCGMTGDFDFLLYKKILPGIAVSLLLGNLFYAWQAHRLARRDVRKDVTALPYGINTPSLLVYIFFVMAPVYRETGDAELAWLMGLVACGGSGVIELLGSFLAQWVRKHTPRAALLSTLAGIAIGFIAMTFALQIWTRPLVAMIPLAIILVAFFSGTRFPLSLPGGLIAIMAGTAIAWLGPLLIFISEQVSIFPESLRPFDWLGVKMDPNLLGDAWQQRGWRLPIWAGNELFDFLGEDPSKWLKYLSVIIPMGLFNVIGSLQNIESAEAAGDEYDTTSSLAVNGIGTIAAALFGSCFPTTIYIGHPGWKGLGARAGYSTLNGLVITLICLSGTVAFISALIPTEAGIAIVLWIGIVMTAQAFQTTPHQHAPAVAIGLFPAIAAWGATVAYGAFFVAGGTSIQTLLENDPDTALSGFFLHGLIVMERGYIFTCMILASIAAFLIDKNFRAAAFWALLGFVFTITGLIHAYQLSGNTVDYLLIGVQPAKDASTYHGYAIAAGYLSMAMVFWLVGVYGRRSASESRDIR